MQKNIDPNMSLRQFLEENNVSLEDIIEFTRSKTILSEEVIDHDEKKVLSEVSIDASKFDVAEDMVKVYATKDPEKQLDLILEKCLLWKDMSTSARVDFSVDVTAFMLNQFGIDAIYLSYESELEDFHAEQSGKDIRISIPRTLNLDSPIQLISTMAHEITHRTQELISMTAKKNMVNTPNFSKENILYGEFADTNNASVLIYSSAPAEMDSNFKETEMMAIILHHLISTHPKQAEYVEFTGELETFNRENEETLMSDMERVVELSFISSEIEKIVAKAKKHVSEIAENICEMSKYSKEDFDKYMNTYLTQKGLNDYLCIASKEVDQNAHANLLSALLKHDRIEAINVVNVLPYEHTSAELVACAKLLEEEVGRDYLYPSLLRAFTHISEKELSSACNAIIGKDYTKEQRLATKEVIKNHLMMHEHLKKTRLFFDTEENTRDVDTDNMNEYSMLLNNIYPAYIRDYIAMFCDEYASILEDNLIKKNIPNAKQKISDIENGYVAMTNKCKEGKMQYLEDYYTNYKMVREENTADIQ